MAKACNEALRRYCATLRIRAPRRAYMSLADACVWLPVSKSYKLCSQCVARLLCTAAGATICSPLIPAIVMPDSAFDRRWAHSHMDSAPRLVAGVLVRDVPRGGRRRVQLQHRGVLVDHQRASVLQVDLQPPCACPLPVESLAVLMRSAHAMICHTPSHCANSTTPGAAFAQHAWRDWTRSWLRPTRALPNLPSNEVTVTVRGLDAKCQKHCRAQYLLGTRLCIHGEVPLGHGNAPWVS